MPRLAAGTSKCSRAQSPGHRQLPIATVTFRAARFHSLLATAVGSPGWRGRREGAQEHMQRHAAQPHRVRRRRRQPRKDHLGGESGLDKVHKVYTTVRQSAGAGIYKARRSASKRATARQSAPQRDAGLLEKQRLDHESDQRGTTDPSSIIQHDSQDVQLRSLPPGEKVSKTVF